jgi:hypothetical protein
MARSAATATENKPVYRVLYMYGPVNDAHKTTITHKNKDPISIFLPALNRLIVLILGSLGVNGEERP